MIMSQYNSGSIRQNRWLEALARMHDRRCETSNRDRIDTYDFVLLIEHQHKKVLSICISQELMYKRTCISTASYLFVVTMQSAFTYQGYAINGNRGTFFLLGRRLVLQRCQLLTVVKAFLCHGK